MDLERVERIIADAIGEPGRRTFYLQFRAASQLITVIVEKQQVQLLAASIDELLGQIDRATAAAPSPADLGLGLEEPIEPRWRVGKLSLGYHEDLDLLLLEVEELVPEDEEEDEETGRGEGEPVVTTAHEPDRVRVWATREQMAALSRHAVEVAAAGRPACRYCGNPLDPEGHVCPAMNGHGSPST